MIVRSESVTTASEERYRFLLVPSSLHFLSDKRNVIFSATGLVTGSETIAAAQDVRRLVATKQIRGILVDFCNALELSASTQELRSLAAITVEISQRSQGASLAIAASEDHVFGAARMCEVFAENLLWQVELFRDSQSAIRWLGLPETFELGSPIGTYSWPAA